MARKTRKTRGKPAPSRIVADVLNAAQPISKEAHERIVRNAEIKNKNDTVSGLENCIADYASAMVADSWKGGGDPGDIPVIEAQLESARAMMNRHLLEVRRLLLGNPNLN